MNNNEPLVSVILTTYNRPDFLKIAIQSILDQTYKNWELIVVNDAGENVQHIIDSYNDNRIQYIHKENNAGLGEARNTGLEYAKGKYANFIDDDDGFFKYHLQTLVEYLEENQYQIAYTDAVCDVMNKNEYGNYVVTNKVIAYSIDYDADMFLYQNITPVLCVMFELNDITKSIKLKQLRVYEDWCYWLELTKYYDMHHIAIPTCYYTFRNDGSTMSSSRNEFTTLLPSIYKETFPRAKNQTRVALAMNQILQARNLQPMFQILSK